MEITPEILRKMQLLELKILVEVKRVCDKHNIAFILIGGSLIGAIRHKGFIPWDDDIDVGMTRDNYDKFCKIAPSELSNEFFLQTPSTDPQYFDYCLARVQLNGTKVFTRYEPANMKHEGFRIDILPYDNIPNSFLRGYLYHGIFNIFIRVCVLRNGYHLYPQNFIMRLIIYLGFVLCLPISTKKLKSILENYYKKYEKLNSSHVVLLRGRWGFKKERHLRSTISKIIYIPFEDTLMPVPEDYHLFLSEQYGDYLTPPPVNSRGLHHTLNIDFGIYA
ncbi:MAG: LicD family protein [Treponema sp.]|jgi:lipopolysaccharide cholinephosphotransferase|nr:LicD family protein [Treponema sp.]